MVQQNSLTRRTFQCIHQNNSLIFQFIIAEYINGSIPLESISSLLPESHRGSMGSLQSSLEALSGSLQEIYAFYFMEFRRRDPFKAQMLYPLFAANSDLHSKRLQLEKNTSQAWKISLEALDFLRLIQDQQH